VSITYREDRILTTKETQSFSACATSTANVRKKKAFEKKTKRGSLQREIFKGLMERRKTGAFGEKGRKDLSEEVWKSFLEGKGFAHVPEGGSEGVLLLI